MKAWYVDFSTKKKKDSVDSFIDLIDIDIFPFRYQNANLMHLFVSDIK
jgi:superoxide dismutase